MANALIGYTGFVGGNLLRQATFEGLFNSKNVEELAGKSYDILVCSGAPAEKWKANQEPETDRKSLGRLMDALGRVRARKVVLISTVDVYSVPRDVDEDSPIIPQPANAYGRHRHELEEFVRARFDALVVRLPGLFGEGLKKNVIYDFLHDNRVEAIHSEGVFQFYGLENLWKDVKTALDAGLQVVNFSTQPTRVADIARECFGRDFDNRPHNAPASYDMRSRHAHLFGGRDGYLYSKPQVLERIRAFVHAKRKEA
ncbi:NAD-dependent epimerase/dehydratase family protein [Vitiosangium sp. GDMCC 1.1324]|uniref:NAD-dependent epimerase/dehydratase family protein n=1 Tax=Vitiosangium sp. (strain GDMCC 1.1324) TaxID=2138576 RepID=UPI000D361683|nr:NAD-dependent epimerase/dehydratase family protein [Vitiosangium sp. GDMCC 1.1324]PTL80226.1 pyridine nucleotide transhydrogenase [Vitiosangium sp. GDMCC 1.1324]